MTAAGTGLGAGKPAVDLDQVFTRSPGFIRQLRDQTVPTGIGDMLGQCPGFQQILDLQRLDYHRLVIVSDLPRQFVCPFDTD